MQVFSLHLEIWSGVPKNSNHEGIFTNLLLQDGDSLLVTKIPITKSKFSLCRNRRVTLVRSWPVHSNHTEPRRCFPTVFHFQMKIAVWHPIGAVILPDSLYQISLYEFLLVFFFYICIITVMPQQLFCICIIDRS